MSGSVDPERFWRRVAKPVITEDDPCWVWLGALNPAGYGVISVTGADTPSGYTSMAAHRVAYELEVAPISPKFQLDHLCRNRACVNPNHLEEVPPKVNTRRARPYRKPSPTLNHTASVHYSKSTAGDRWRVCFRRNGRQGNWSYTTPEEAEAVAAQIREHGIDYMVERREKAGEVRGRSRWTTKWDDKPEKPCGDQNEGRTCTLRKKHDGWHGVRDTDETWTD